MKKEMPAEAYWFMKAAKYTAIVSIVCLLIALFFQFIAPIKLVMEIFYLIAALTGAGCIGSLIEMVLDLDLE